MSFHASQQTSTSSSSSSFNYSSPDQSYYYNNQNFITPQNSRSISANQFVSSPLPPPSSLSSLSHISGGDEILLSTKDHDAVPSGSVLIQVSNRNMIEQLVFNSILINPQDRLRLLLHEQQNQIQMHNKLASHIETIVENTYRAEEDIHLLKIKLQNKLLERQILLNQFYSLEHDHNISHRNFQ
eukprot:c21373_g1_i1.p1 GENE.c21373_g1_i1~~c21373_g1_i1.p1  ORF type:complete len:184 (-),score=26.94 c21373_g1_i1:48-599(-)